MRGKLSTLNSSVKKKKKFTSKKRIDLTLSTEHGCQSARRYLHCCPSHTAANAGSYSASHYTLPLMPLPTLPPLRPYYTALWLYHGHLAASVRSLYDVLHYGNKTPEGRMVVPHKTTASASCQVISNFHNPNLIWFRGTSR